jgi:hypothetical protein
LALFTERSRENPNRVTDVDGVVRRNPLNAFDFLKSWVRERELGDWR